MDLSKFDSASVNLTKQSPGQFSVTFQGKAAATAGELAPLWAQARADLLAEPDLAALDLAPQGGEDVMLKLQQRTIVATFRFVPKAPAKQ